MIAWDIPNLFAIDTEPSTSTLPPKVRSINQTITETIDRKISIEKNLEDSFRKKR
jgi:hypothetical protein